MQTENLSLGLAFLAGLASFLSPCILPLVPSYLSFIAGTGTNSTAVFANRTTTPRVGRTLLFVLGFGVVFVLLGALFAGGGLIAGQYLPLIRIGAGLLVMVFAVNMVFHFIPFLDYEQKVHVKTRPSNGLGAILVGMAFGAGWTPCIGPMLATILFLAGTGGTIGTGILYLVIYTLGLGIPFIAMSLGIDHIKPLVAWMRRHSRPISWVSAAIMLVMGLLIAFGQMTAIARSSVQAGVAIQEWVANPGNALIAHSFATVILLSIFCLPIIRTMYLAMYQKKPISVVVLGFSGFWMLLGTWLVICEWIGIVSFFGTIGTWLQFQGL